MIGQPAKTKLSDKANSDDRYCRAKFDGWDREEIVLGKPFLRNCEFLHATFEVIRAHKFQGILGYEQRSTG